MKNNYKNTASELIKGAAKRLRSEFEYIRTTMHHHGESGEEIETIIKSFLNNYLPKRFRAGSGFILDSRNHISRQCDIIVYDQMLSPIYRASENALILPNHHVASVIEVKSRINKQQLQDSFEKIQVAKSLDKDEPTEYDLPSTGSPVKTYRTLGIVFAFESDISLETIGKNLVEMNKSVDSDYWIDFVIVLDEGILEYQIQYFGDSRFHGVWMPPLSKSFIVPPFYIHLTCKRLGEYSLNWFLGFLNSHLTLFSMRPAYLNFNQLMEGATDEAKTIQGYQHDLDRKIYQINDDHSDKNNRGLSALMKITNKSGNDIGILSYYKWLSGCVFLWIGNISANEFMGAFAHSSKGSMIKLRDNPVTEVSMVMEFSVNEFLKFPDKLNKFTKGDLIGNITEVIKE